MPTLIELHDRYSDKGVVIIGVHDGTVTTAKQLVEQTKTAREGTWNGRSLPFPTAIAGGGAVKVDESGAQANGQAIADYKINSFPTTLIIDKQGILVGQVNAHDRAALEKTVEELLAKPGPLVK